MAGEQRTMERAAGVMTELVGGRLIDVHTVAIRWRFTSS